MSPELAQAAVHDLKNALGALESELERLVGVERLEAVRPAHAHCAALRQRLLGFLMLTTSDGRLRARIEAHCPHDIVAHVRAGFVPPPGGASIAIDIADDCPATWFCDQRLVDLALHAALANAVAFARSRIVLGASGSPDGLMFFVEDDGPGLGHGPTPGGSGLGTAVCERVAAAHAHGDRRGRAVLGMGALGGARFELHLP